MQYIVVRMTKIPVKENSKWAVESHQQNIYVFTDEGEYKYFFSGVQQSPKTAESKSVSHMYTKLLSIIGTYIG